MCIKKTSVRLITFSISILFMFENSSCIKRQEINKNKESEIQEVTNTLNTVFSWAIQKDFDLFYNAIANDADFRSVTPYKRVKFGFNEVKKDSAFWGDPKFKAIRHEIRDLHIHLSKSGTVAWFYCLLDDINEWDGRPVNWENVAWTGVLEKRNGKWKVVQQHFSFASNNSQ